VKTVFNLVLAFMFGAAFLAACQKVAETPRVVPHSSQTSVATPLPTGVRIDAYAADLAAQAAAVNTLAATNTPVHKAPAARTPVVSNPPYVPLAHAARRDPGAASAEKAAYALAYSNAVVANRLLGAQRYRTHA
jgi:hypothetical protein